MKIVGGGFCCWWSLLSPGYRAMATLKNFERSTESRHFLNEEDVYFALGFFDPVSRGGFAAGISALGAGNKCIEKQGELLCYASIHVGSVGSWC